MEVRLDGRSAIITGASMGLGLAMAKEFAASGADVAILARSPEVLEQAKQTVSATAKGGRVATFVCDVSKADEIQQTYDAVIKAFGKVDILINNAGQSMAMPAEQITDEIWQRRSRAETVRSDPPDPAGLAGDEAAQMGPHHQRAEHRREGAPRERRAHRGVARRRHGVHEGARRRGRAARHPGERHAGGADRLRPARAAATRAKAPTCRIEEFIAKIGTGMPVGRMGKAEEFAAMACFLCSDHAGFTTGTAINMDGGASPVV